MYKVIGSEFNISNTKLKCIEDDGTKGCKSCFFNFNCFSFIDIIGLCNNRIDNKNVIFIKIN